MWTEVMTLRIYFRDLDIMKKQLLGISFDSTKSSCCDQEHQTSTGTVCFFLFCFADSWPMGFITIKLTTTNLGEDFLLHNLYSPKSFPGLRSFVTERWSKNVWRFGLEVKRLLKKQFALKSWRLWWWLWVKRSLQIDGFLLWLVHCFGLL